MLPKFKVYMRSLRRSLSLIIIVSISVVHSSSFKDYCLISTYFSKKSLNMSERRKCLRQFATNRIIRHNVVRTHDPFIPNKIKKTLSTHFHLKCNQLRTVFHPTLDSNRNTLCPTKAKCYPVYKN